MKKDDQFKKFNLKETIAKDWPIFLLILGSFIFGLVVYPSLPDRIPMHWGINGQANRYAPKSFSSVFLLPLISIGLYILFISLPYIDPKRRNYSSFIGSYQIIKQALFLFFSGLYVVTMLISLGYKINIGFIVTLGVGALFTVMGNAMSRLRHNYFIGIKTPWTLANEEVWRKTHRFGAYIWVAAGISMILGAFAGTTFSHIILLITIGILVIVPTIYSYLIFNKINKS